MSYYERNLPHWHPPGKHIFLTWRLYGSLPATFVHSLQSQPSAVTQASACMPLTSSFRTARVTQASACVPLTSSFRTADAELDKALHGPLWLKDPRVADCVVEALHRGEHEWNFYQLHAYVVMANHVHILIEPRVPLPRVTQRLKGSTARTANQILAREGNRFWADESFDHWVRSAQGFNRIALYIEQNPVTAGLVKNPQAWPWSSAK
jgi:putative transposase